MNGIICVNKPADWTSFDVVAKVRGMASTRKAGHAGTLDPMATGVLPVFLGNATKVCDILPNDDKGYIAGFKLGVTTDTLDITGEVKTETKSHITKLNLIKACEKYKGEIDQIPPMYSAVRVGGRRLYDMAREGVEVERKPRRVTIKELEILSFDENTQQGRMRVLCSKGTYIRTLISDIGEDLSVGAVMTSLVRNIAGGFTLNDCYTLEELQDFTDNKTLENKLIKTEKVFEHLPKIKLNAVQSNKFINGVKLDLNRVYYKEEKGFHRVFSNEGTFLGLASLDLEKMELVIEKMFYKEA